MSLVNKKGDPGDGMASPAGQVTVNNAMSAPGSAPGTPSMVLPAPSPSQQHSMNSDGQNHSNLPSSSPQHHQPPPPSHPGHPHQSSMMQSMPPHHQQQHHQHQQPPPQMQQHQHQQGPPGQPPMLPNGPPPPQKGSMSMDSQYMQQQSQIFVFTTGLANAAAEHVTSGQFPSVIAYHCSQPDTKRYLEQYPLRVQQFNKPNHGSWLNNLAQKPGAKGFRHMNPNMMHNPNQFPGGPGGPPNGLNQFSSFKPMPGGGPGMGPCQPNHNMNPQMNCPGPPNPNNWGDGPWPPNYSNNMGPNQRFPNQGGPMPPRPHNNSAMMCPPFNGSNNFPGPGMNPNFPPNSTCNTSSSLPMPSGTKIPDEELTPQQRQHREEQLARLRQIQQVLFHPDGDKSHGGPGGPPGPNNGMMRMPGPNQNMDPNGQVNMPGGMMPDDSTNDGSMGHNSAMSCGPGSVPGQSPGPNTPQDWMKMQQPFSDQNQGQRKGSQPRSSPAPNTVPSSPRMPVTPLPPPPYQGPRPMSSPHPASPATNSMPLLSPRMQSPADAARQAQHRLPPYPSPGPGTPSNESSMSLSHNNLGSPKRETPQPLASNTSGNGVTTNGSRNAPTPSDQDKKEKVHADILSSLKQEPGQQQMQQHQLSKSIGSLSNSCSSPISNVKNEPQLMPVPSPQHIQYLNNFDGQELTIQKQPNTGLRDADLISPPDLNFVNDFPPTSFPSHCSQENGLRFGNPMMDGPMNQRFMGPGPGSGPPNGGPPFDMQNPGMRPFMGPDGGMHRMSFDGNRMPCPMENGHMHRPGMGHCNDFGPPMDGNPNMMRFSPGHPGNPNFMQGMRMRGPPPGEMGGRFPGPGGPPPQMMNDPNMQPPFGNQMMNSSMMPMDHPNFGGPGMPPNGAEGVSSTHLQSLQKMTPPFDIGSSPGGKMEMGNPMSGPGMHGHMGQQMGQRTPFEALSSMAAMGDNSPNPGLGGGMMGPNPMSMSPMPMGGPPGQGNMNFPGPMTSMANGPPGQMGGPCSNPNGMPGQFNVNQGGMGMGGPPPANSPFPNDNSPMPQMMQNMTPPNYNSNMMPNQPGMPGHNHPNQMPGNMMIPTSMSPKLGQNGMMGGPRMSSPGPQGSPFPPNGPPPRGMSPFPQGQPGPGPRGGFSGPNIQVKPNAPNTIQYLPNRPQSMPPHPPQNKTPNLDFLKHTLPLTNLDKKVPTHNLQYFPGGPPNGPPMNQPPSSGNMPMSIGPGRPQHMMRGPGPPNHMGPGPNMVPGEMFNRPPGPNMFPGGMNGGPGDMMGGGMPPDGGHPGMPPHMGNFGYNKQPNYMSGPMGGGDPSYDRGYQHFQQQLYATNARGNNPQGNNVNCNSNHNNMAPAPNFYGQSK
ncbi:Protein BCL9 -like protein [Halotydeus destructor]|nr:Protein BCL9 -like protein [Halotydeus destructor]